MGMGVFLMAFKCLLFRHLALKRLGFLKNGFSGE